MVSEVQYGGKITDDLDRRLFNAYASRWVSKGVLSDDFQYAPPNPIQPIPEDFQYVVRSDNEIAPYREYATSFPDIDSPELFGLHPNADLTFRVKEVNALLGAMAETQPRVVSGGAGKSLDEIVTEKANELLEKLPEDYIEDDYKLKIRKLGGMTKPLNIFLYQEIQRLQNVIALVRHQLQQMKLAIRGEVVLTTELQQSMQELFDAKVPSPWLKTPGGDEFSWLIANLGQWFASLVERDTQIRTWLENKAPVSYWMTGFFNPQGFLTAMKQEVTRAHKKEGWALDNVQYHMEVTDMLSGDQVRDAPEEGVFVHGLFMDGARWDRKEGSIVESEPKKLFAAVPVLYVTGLRNSLVGTKKDIYSPTGLAPYMCPLYRYPARTDFFLVVSVPMPTRVQKNEHWTLRGVALLCLTHM
jgi:dynein heavy chain